MATDERSAKLILGVESKGTDKAARDIAGIGKTAKQLDRDLKGIGKDNALATSFKEADAALDKLTSDIRSDLNGALKEAADTAGSIKPGGDGSGGGSVPAAAKFRGAASLIGGGEIVGLIDDFQDLGEGLVELKNSAPDAAAQLFSLAGAMGPAGLLAAGAAAVAVVTLGAVLKTFTDERAREAETVRGIIDANKNARTKAIDGATTADLEKDISRLTQLRQLEADQIKENARLYEQGFTEDGFVDTLATLGSTIDDELAGSTARSEQAIKDFDIEMAALRLTITEGRTAINDTKVSEQELAQVRETETPKSIDTAVNAERERAREMEKAARERERAQAEAAREQERIAQEQQRQAEQAAAAQQKYADGIKNANTALKQSTQDINTKLTQGLADNLTGLFRDVSDISEKFRRDTFDADLKANAAERDATTEHLRDIDDIRADAYKSEAEAIRDGDFKQLFLARQSGADALRQEQKETQRESEDRRRALSDERSDLLRATGRERTDRQTAYERQSTDTRTAAQREIQQAQVARTRALEANAAGYAAELKQQSQFLQQRNQILAQANQAGLQGMGGSTSNSRIPVNASTSQYDRIQRAYVQQVIRK